MTTKEEAKPRSARRNPDSHFFCTNKHNLDVYQCYVRPKENPKICFMKTMKRFLDHIHQENVCRETSTRIYRPCKDSIKYEITRFYLNRIFLYKERIFEYSGIFYAVKIYFFKLFLRNNSNK